LSGGTFQTDFITNRQKQLGNTLALFPSDNKKTARNGEYAA